MNPYILDAGEPVVQLAPDRGIAPPTPAREPVEPRYFAPATSKEDGARYLKSYLETEKARREDSYKESEARALGYESAAARLQEQMAESQAKLMGQVPGTQAPQYGIGDLVAGLGGMALGQGGAALNPIQERAMQDAELRNRQNMTRFELEKQLARSQMDDMASQRESFLDQAMDVRSTLDTQRGQDYRAELTLDQRQEAAYLKTPEGIRDQLVSMGFTEEEANGMATAKMQRDQAAAGLTNVRAELEPIKVQVQQQKFELDKRFKDESIKRWGLDRASRERIAKERTTQMIALTQMRIAAGTEQIYLRHELDMQEAEFNASSGDRKAASKVAIDAKAKIAGLEKALEELGTQSMDSLMIGSQPNPNPNLTSLQDTEKKKREIQQTLAAEYGRLQWAEGVLSQPSAAPNIVQAARAKIGTPYVWGGESKGGADCSGVVCAALNAAGVPIERATADGLWNHSRGQRVEFSDIQPGDLIFFHNTQKQLGPGKASHVGIYVGNGRMIDASASKGQTVERPVPASLKAKILGVKRFD